MIATKEANIDLGEPQIFLHYFSWKVKIINAIAPFNMLILPFICILLQASSHHWC